MYDANERTRLQAFLELQYDLRESDRELVRFLFEQEIMARERCGSSERSADLDLAGYLLASFHDPRDTPLFVRAKLSPDMDTGCGFSWEYAFIACRERTAEYLQAHCPDLAETMRCELGNLDVPYGLDHLDQWWGRLVSKYPGSEDKEDLWALYERSLAFDDPVKAAHYLEVWIAEEPESEDKLSTMQYHYAELGNYGKAAEAARRLLDQSTTDWDRASRCEALIELYRKAGDFESAADIARQLDTHFSRFDDWTSQGLGRMAIHCVFELSLEHPDIHVAKELFALADSWFARISNLHSGGLRAGAEAADRCGLEKVKERYEALDSRYKASLEVG